MKRMKFGNKKIMADDDTFDSQGEYRRWCDLQLMQKAGVISELERQVSFVLAPSVVIDKRKKPEMKFTLDFQYKSGGELVLEDFKSPSTAKETAFIMRRHLLKSVHGLDVKITYK